MTAQTGFLPAAQNPFKSANAFNLASFTVGAKAGSTINVAVQLKDARGRAVAQRCKVDVFLSDNADGSTLTATAATTPPAVHTNGVLLGILTTGKVWGVVSDASGRFDIDVIQSASPVTQYLCVVMPDGSVAVSGALAF